MRKLLPILALYLSLLPSLVHSDQQLPDIGGSGYSIISEQQEYLMGRAWARMLRGSTKIYEDALVSQYIEELTWELVTHSQLVDKRLEILVLDNPTVNAFAAPGGIIGVHSGLILTAKNEAQLASVLAHELAHLSQRHFASQLEEQRKNRPLFLASILGSILLAAADPEAGMAGLQASMAGSISNRLSFSRQNEREADSIGFQTLQSAGYDPKEMANMFQQLQQQARFSSKPPEFLLTHPITQSRISESLNRASSSNSKTGISNSLEFKVIQARVQRFHAKDNTDLLNYFLQRLEEHDDDAARYAVVIAAIKNKDFNLAEQQVALLTNAFKKSLYGRLLEPELLLAKGKLSEARDILIKLSKIYPDNAAIQFLSAETDVKLNRPDSASLIYRSLIESEPTDVRAWYLLAETYGLEGNRIGVHEARTEYFLLTANVDRAINQIHYALKEPGLSLNKKAYFEQRLIDAKAIRESLKMDF